MNRRLNLKRPLAVLDLETTGVAPETDRIIEIAILKIYPDGRETKYCKRIDPRVPIPPEATRVHGISNEHVKDCPRFRKVAGKIARFLENCDLAGFNLIKFDLPLLESEFRRANVEFSSEERRIVDACHIFHRREPRHLAAALSFYCSEEHSDAHSALADARACWKVLVAQIDKYTDLPADLDGLHGFCNERNERFVDDGRKFEWRHNEPAFTFGKHKGRSLKQVAKDDPEYLTWMTKGDFRPKTKAIVCAALKGKFTKRTGPRL